MMPITKLLSIGALAALLAPGCSGRSLGPSDSGFDVGDSRRPPPLDLSVDIARDAPRVPDASLPPGPVRLLLILDSSGSMEMSDPKLNVQQAVSDLVQHLPKATDLALAIIRFNSKMAVNEGLTPGLTSDPTAIQAAIKALSQRDLATDYQGALVRGHALLKDELGKMDPTARSRARFVIVFLADGAPSPICQAGCNNDPSPVPSVKGGWCDLPRQDWCAAFNPPDCKDMITWYPALTSCGSYNNRFDLTAEVSQILALASSMKVGELRLHTILLSSLSKLDPAVQVLFGFDKVKAEAELKSLAQVGSGSYLDVEDPAKLSFLSYDLSPLP
jgi:hypothetical protein